MVAQREQTRLPMLVIHRLRVVGQERRAGERAGRHNPIQANGQRDDFDDGVINVR